MNRVDDGGASADNR